jgi:hypothetical protein
LDATPEQVSDVARMLVRSSMKGNDPSEVHELEARALTGDAEAHKKLELWTGLQQAAGAHARAGQEAQLKELEGQSDAFLKSVTPAELAAVNDQAKANPLLAQTLAHLDQVGVPQKLDASAGDVDSAVHTWLRGNVKHSLAEINLLTAQAQLGDVGAQKQLALVGAIEQVYTQLLQQAQGAAPVASGQ